MANYIIIELDDGLTAVELTADQTAEDVAIAQGGLLVDEGSFATIEEANDAIDNLKEAEEEEKRA